jgi:hypothetical protein
MPADGNDEQGTAVELSSLQSSGRRCPWYRDVVELAARPLPPYERSVGMALVFAGSHAWQLAADVRDAGRRALTLLPPGAEPESLRWPPVHRWIGDCGDLDSTRVVQLARVLVGAGAMRVHLMAKGVDGGHVNVRAVD